MRTKVLSVHNMISWSCFQLLKSAIPCVEIHPPEPIPKPNIKLIHCDGLVKIYHRPVHVSQVLLEFPKHLVCRSDSFFIGQKVPPLPDHELLQLGHKYFLLPKPFFHSVLSFVTIASFFSSSSSSSAADNGRFLNSAASCRRPFDIQRTPSGGLRIRVSDEFISRLLQQGKINAQQKEQESSELTRICNTPQLAKDYTQLVRRTQWKPKLETITERQNRHLLSPFGHKKKKKKPPPSPPPPLHHLRPTQFVYKPKIRIKSRD